MFYQSRNPLAATSPLRSMQWGRPAALVLGYSEAETAAWELDRARLMLVALEDRFAGACRALGDANRLRFATNIKRMWQGKAMRSLNSARAQLRAARARLVAAELAMTALATVRA